MGSQLRLLRVSQPRDCCFEQMFVSVSAGLRTSPVCLFIVVPSKFRRFHNFFHMGLSANRLPRVQVFHLCKGCNLRKPMENVILRILVAIL